MEPTPLSAASRARAEEPFRLLVESVVDYAIFMLDPQGRVQTWNTGAARIKGYSAEEIIGKHFSIFYAQDAIARGWPDYELQEAVRQGRFEDEGWRVRKGGAEFWANVIITPLYDEGRKLRGFAKITRDLTERRRIEALESSTQRMTEFLAMVAHELRNPLAPLRNATEILRARPDDVTNVQWSVGMLERQVAQLTRLVDDLLDVSRVTSGKIAIGKEPVDLGAVAQRAVDAVRFSAEARNQKLSAAMPGEPLMVDGDSVRLYQVVVNLLNNAVKYTPEGGAIRCEVHRIGDEAVLCVRDTGMGIPTELQEHVFELFTQGERSLHRSEGGLGIGLALVERLVRLHGGRVTVHSAGRDCGSEFSVHLPLRGAAQPPGSKAQEAPRDNTAGMAASRILVVDDNRDAADSLADLLRIWGNDVEVCYDGLAAIDCAESFRPHIAVLDIGLPRLDGYELARRFAANPGLRDTVLIAITGYAQEEDLRRVRDAGFHHHLIKPVDVDTLLQLLAGDRPYETGLQGSTALSA